MINVEKILEIEKIKEKLTSFTYTENAKIKIRELKPFLSIREVKAAQRETSEARRIIEYAGNPPLTSFDDIGEYLMIAEKGGCLTAEQIEKTAVTLTGVKRLKDYLSKTRHLENGISYYDENLDSLDPLREEISRMIRSGKVDDYATKELKSVRREIEHLKERMRAKADSVLKSNKASMSDSFTTIRNGRICLPVKAECKLKISGSVIDKSATGNTLFIEPAAVAKYGDELSIKEIEEENEVQRILYELTARISDAAEAFSQNQKVFEKLDFIFAKGMLSLAYGGTEPVVTQERTIKLKNARHPLMDQDICVPLQFQIGGETSGVIITGPNTGGKTVAIKTVGINCYIGQCGLHTAAEQAEISMHNQILCDIGDGQNIAENLSTFSAHITNVLEILKRAGTDSLVIMDELGSGTDPTEGMGIAVAILEELRKTGALFLVTTHYPEVKNYAERTTGVVNARMTFDRESLAPFYQLEIGKAGDSCALYIAKKLGMPKSMLACASKAAYGEEREELLAGITTEEIRQVSTTKLQTDKKNKSNRELRDKFKLGDSVMVFPDRKIGIVCEKINEKGVLRVQMPDKKIWINHKRVKMHVAASELYPEDYDFSIIFDTVEQRKASHQMSRKYNPDLEIEYN